MFITLAPAYAQLTFGLKAGGNLNGTAIKVPTDFSYETGSHLSFHAGVFTHVPLSDKLALMPELQFVQKGYVIDGSPNDVRINLNYLELPVIGILFTHKTTFPGSRPGNRVPPERKMEFTSLTIKFTALMRVSANGLVSPGGQGKCYDSLSFRTGRLAAGLFQIKCSTGI